MSEQVSRAEFNELKGQLDLVCQHLGLELGDFLAQGSGRRRAEPVEVQDFSGFEQETVSPEAQEEDLVFADEEEGEGWESINDDEDSDHTISYDQKSDDEDDEEDEEEIQEDELEEEAPAVKEEVRHLPTSLNYVDFAEEEKSDEDEEPLFSDEDEEDPYDSTPVLQETSPGVTPDVLSRIFDAEKILTANDVASKQFSEIKKSLFTSPYDVDAVDGFLDEYLEVLQTKEISESKYAEALLKLSGRKFPENSEGYKKAEVDSFVEEISKELKRRIEIVS